MTDEVEYEVRCDGEPVAWTVGPREQALTEARHYAVIYAPDGPTEVFEVHKTFTRVE
jgi:hypothetical protein